MTNASIERVGLADAKRRLIIVVSYDHTLTR